MSKSICVSIVAAFSAVLMLMGAAPRDFVPDVVFKGSALTGWRSVGQADWRAMDGELVATPKGQEGGWLIQDKSYQDIQVYAEFQCSQSCKPGILLRAEKTNDGGLKGVLISLTSGDTETYEVVLSAEGKEIERTRLARATAQFARMAAGPWTNGQAHVPGFSRQAPTVMEQQTEAAKPPAVSSPKSAGAKPGFTPPRPTINANDWNTVQVIVDADMVWVTLNGRRGFANTATTDRAMGYGPIALYAGGEGEVRFKDISLKDLNRKVEPAESISKNFRKQQVNDFFYSWGATVGDVTHDGIPDVIAGPFYYVGPEYTERREFTAARSYSPTSNFPQGMVYFAHDFTGDGWTDIVVVDSRPIFLYVNPKGQLRRWDRFNVVPNAISEIEVFRDIDGDGKPEVLLTAAGGVFSYAKPDPANPTATWKVHAISDPGMAAAHGMGVGDINRDGRMDVVNNRGWWEQPAKGLGEGPWKFHAQDFGSGGAEMGIYDVNGDKLADIVTGLSAHGWGLAWFEQKRDPQGATSFVRHDIMGDFTTNNAGGVTFSEPHGSTFADLDGDGVLDLIVGKRLFSHLESHIDPDPYGAAVVYWYKTVRNPKAAGGAEFVPELIHNRSGVGSQFVASDLNRDGSPDIITSGPKGTFVFWNSMGRANQMRRAGR